MFRLRICQSVLALFILIFVLSVLSPIPSVSSVQNATTATITVNPDIRYQTFEGFGGTLTVFEDKGVYKRHDPIQPEEVFATQEDRLEIARLIYTEIGVNRTRVVLTGFEPTNDNGDSFSINPTGFDWLSVDPKIAFFQLSQPYGLVNGWASFAFDGSEADSWRRVADSHCALNPEMIDEEVEWLLAAALHFQEMGYPLDYMTINNEPDLCPPGFKIEIDDYVTIAKRLGARLREAGLETMLVVGDNWVPANGLLYMNAVLADPEARPYVGALAYHSYDAYDNDTLLAETSLQGTSPHNAASVREEIRDLALEYNLPVWMTEVCWCAPRDRDEFELLLLRLNHIQDELTITNVSAFDVMNLAFLDRPGIRDELVHVYFASDGNLAKYTISPYGQLLMHYARSIEAGSVRVEANSDNALVRVVAFERPDGKLALIILNNSTDEVSITLNDNIHQQHFAVRQSTSESLGQELDTISGTLTLPARSVTTLISLEE